MTTQTIDGNQPTNESPNPTDQAEVRVTPRPFREEQAWKEIGQTTYAPGTRNVIIIGFLVFLLIVPIVQFLMPRSSYAELSGKGSKDGADGAQAEASIPADAVQLSATVSAISAPPETGGVYNDFLMQIHATDIVDAAGQSVEDRLILCFGMRERVILPTAAIRPGDQITIQAVSWDSVAPEFGGMNGSALKAMISC